MTSSDMAIHMSPHTSSCASSRSSAVLRAVLLCLAWFAQPVAGNEQGAEVDEDRSAVAASADTTAQNRYWGQPTTDGRYRVSTRFRNFDGQTVALGFDLATAESRRSLSEFGVDDRELDALMRLCRQAMACDQATYDGYTTRYYREHALRLTADPGRASRLSVDVPAVVLRNRSRVRPLTDALRRAAAERGQNGDWMIKTAMTLVQTALPYKKPVAQLEGRSLLGFYPPAFALERGYGDCDTKSALLAAMLLDLGESRVVGLHVPGHYLLGLDRRPEADEAFITHQGRPFVLVEAAGPAMRGLGDVSMRTRGALARNDGLRVDPMF
ncbi:hypothetical protein [Hydrocarboniphaga effusa]|uniref:hypothetical protein n=2 Tax=Hydrocarboniphaga effusa TaxID=243629 RepID=UPI0031381932